MRRLLPLLVVAGCAAGVQLARQDISDPGQLLFNGYVREDIDCYICHGGDGRGSARGPDLAERIPKLTDAQLVETMVDGPGLMPDYDEDLRDHERQQIARWLRAALGNGPPVTTSTTPVNPEVE